MASRTIPYQRMAGLIAVLIYAAEFSLSAQAMTIGTQSQVLSFTTQVGSENDTFDQLQQFDPAVGQLLQVEATYVAEVSEFGSTVDSQLIALPFEQEVSTKLNFGAIASEGSPFLYSGDPPSFTGVPQLVQLSPSDEPISAPDFEGPDSAVLSHPPVGPLTFEENNLSLSPSFIGQGSISVRFFVRGVDLFQSLGLSTDEFFGEVSGHLVVKYTFQTAASGLVGDYNGDDFVSQSDLDLVLLNWGVDTTLTGTPIGWVLDAPTGLISQDELDAVLLNWGASASGNIASIPEPATGGVVLISSLAMYRLGTNQRPKGREASPAY